MTTPTIILIGFMGAGKTLVGQTLAQKRDVGFFDVDHEIEKAANKTIPNIFSEDGEAAFRDIETQVLQQAVRFPGIVATGGGSVDRPENVAILKQSGATIIYLYGPLEDTIKRLLPEKQRPLLNQKSTLAFFELWQKRDPLYRSVADYVVEIVDKPAATIVNEIINTIDADVATKDLLYLRSQIDTVDRKLINLIAKRMQLVDEVADYKKSYHMPVVQKDRMNQMRAALKNEFSTHSHVEEQMIDELLNLLLKMSIEREREQLE